MAGGGRRLSEVLREQQEPFLLHGEPCCSVADEGARASWGRAVRRALPRWRWDGLAAGCFPCATRCKRESFRPLPRAGHARCDEGVVGMESDGDDGARRLSPVSVLDVLRCSDDEEWSSSPTLSDCKPYTTLLLTSPFQGAFSSVSRVIPINNSPWFHALLLDKYRGGGGGRRRQAIVDARELAATRPAHRREVGGGVEEGGFVLGADRGGHRKSPGACGAGPVDLHVHVGEGVARGGGGRAGGRERGGHDLRGHERGGRARHGRAVANRSAPCPS
uniref:Uncharacterized protein n=1 Tax=Aegilops tauschii subsp. strangulata TaxID=200361 RepID=A0A453JGL8_AEGTS